MKLLVLLNILFLSSIVFTFPLLQGDEELVILPDTPIQIEKIVNTPKLILKIKEPGSILTNVVKIDFNKNTTLIIINNQTINSQLEINFDSPGVYLFNFESTSINTLIFQPSGIYLPQLLVMLFLGIMNITIYMRSRNKDKI
ncbi:MAG: hypothetical protein GPJ54_21535 [Candidatus Heimdallarchaeota archaeon]|nr:hypothetical protein [Candidatus Heimdallarchaeota archaeon]